MTDQTIPSEGVLMRRTRSLAREEITSWQQRLSSGEWTLARTLDYLAMRRDMYERHETVEREGSPCWAPSQEWADFNHSMALLYGDAIARISDHTPVVTKP